MYCWENKEREKQKLERLAGQLVELLHCQEDARRGLEKEQQQIEREEELIDKLKNQLGQLSGRDVQLTALLERRKALEQKYHALWECWREWEEWRAAYGQLEIQIGSLKKREQEKCAKLKQWQQETEELGDISLRRLLLEQERKQREAVKSRILQQQNRLRELEQLEQKLVDAQEEYVQAYINSFMVGVIGRGKK